MSANNVEIIKINEKTWRIEDDFVRFFLLEGQKNALLIDSGVDCPDAQEIAQKLTTKPVLLINTHGDGDHTSGNNAFDSFYVAKEDYDFCELGNKFPNAKPSFVEDGQIIDLGERPLKIYKIPGHTKGSIAIVDINAKALFVGDTVSTAIIYMFGKERNIEDYAKTLDRLNSLKDEFDVIYPSHGKPELSPDAISKVQLELEKALAGKLPKEDGEMFGIPITTHQGEFCGFYMPR